MRITKQELHHNARMFYILVHEKWTTAFPPWLKRAASLLARGVGVLVLLWMFYITYRDRDLLLSTLDVTPIYLIPIAACYFSGFLLAIISWHRLLALAGLQYRFIEDYTLYTYMSVCRNVPVPYFHIISMLYTYQKQGAPYATIGLSIVATSLLHIVSGVILFALALSSGLVVAQDSLILGALGIGALVSVALHPSIFRLLLRFKRAESDTEDDREEHTEHHLEAITWRTMLFLVSINVLVLLVGGVMTFFCARALFAVPLTLLPVSIAAWGLIVSITNLLSWLPSDFGLRRIILLLLFQGHLPIALVTAVYAMLRLCSIILDMSNAGIATLLRYQQNRTRAEIGE
jgi:hypothetical protein